MLLFGRSMNITSGKFLPLWFEYGQVQRLDYYAGQAAKQVLCTEDWESFRYLQSISFLKNKAQNLEQNQSFCLLLMIPLHTNPMLLAVYLYGLR